MKRHSPKSKPAPPLPPTRLDLRTLQLLKTKVRTRASEPFEKRKARFYPSRRRHPRVVELDRLEEEVRRQDRLHRAIAARRWWTAVGMKIKSPSAAWKAFEKWKKELP